MKVREAEIDDWSKLEAFFKRIYRVQHPLTNKEFWNWQYGNPTEGRSFICLNDKEEVVGHVGANFKGNIAWIINVYLDAECRGKGILRKLYNLARDYYPLAATAANEAGLGLYRNMRWYRYYDLQRFVKISPNIKSTEAKDVCRQIDVSVDHLRYNQTHYFQQPGIKGIKLKNGMTGVSQENVGGFRVVDLGENIELCEEELWDLGYSWIDYISSWNDLAIKNLIKNDWVIDHQSPVPWRLNPVEEGYYCDITFLSEKPLSNELIVHRSFSDHGRIGSIIS